MTRDKGGSVSKTRRRKVLKAAKGYFGSKHRLYKTAQEQVFHSGNYAFRDRKQNKRNFRKLWITRINAACRENEISYSKFINGLTKAGITINRKMLAELAIAEPDTFKSLVNVSKDALAGKEYKPVSAAKTTSTIEVKETVEKKTTTRKTKATKENADAPKKTTTTKKTTAKKTTTKKEA